MTPIRRLPIAVRLLAAAGVPLIALVVLLGAQVQQARAEGRDAAAELDRMHLVDALAHLQANVTQPEMVAYGVVPGREPSLTSVQQAFVSSYWSLQASRLRPAAEEAQEAARQYAAVLPAGGQAALDAELAALEAVLAAESAAEARRLLPRLVEARERVDSVLSELFLHFEGDGWLVFQSAVLFYRTVTEEFAAVGTTLAGMDTTTPGVILALDGSRQSAVLSFSLGNSRAIHDRIRAFTASTRYERFARDVQRSVAVAAGRTAPDTLARFRATVDNGLAAQEGIDDIEVKAVDDVRRDLEGRLDRAERQERMSLFAAAGILAVTGLVALAMLNSILPAVRQLTRRAAELAAGRLDGAPVRSGGRDELSRLAVALEASASTLSHVNAQAQAIADGRFDDPALDEPAPGALGEVLHQNVLAVRRMASQLRHDADHDALTGVLNRSGLERAVAGIGTAGAAGTHWVLFLDLDGFKGINDTHGHQQGDDVLRTVAQRLLRAVRPEDAVARLGGDEFAVLVPVGPGDDPELLARTVRRLDEAVRAPVPARREPEDATSVTGAPVTVGVSIGAAPLRPGAGLDGVLAAADAEMYAAKQAARVGGGTH